MATTPNAQLTKLAIGIASVAAIAGISGKIAARPPVAAAQDQTPVAAVGSATNTNTAAGGPAAPVPNSDQKYQSPVFSGFDDDDEEEGESEHGGARSFFGATPTQPQSSGTTQQAPQQQQTRRTRSKHS